MPEPTPEDWVQIRHDYEHTDKPLAHICAEHDITIPTVRYRMRRWAWRRRKPLIPRDGPPPVHPPARFLYASAGDPPPPGPAQARPGWEDEQPVADRAAPTGRGGADIARHRSDRRAAGGAGSSIHATWRRPGAPLPR